MQDLAERKAGFSLIEVNVAILVIAGGMLSLFTLFPAGLRMSTAAMSDTRQAFFADQFFAFFEDGLLASKDMQDVGKWKDVTKFWKAGCQGLKDGFDGIDIDDKDWPAKDGDDFVNAIINSWDSSDLKKTLFKMKKSGASGDGTTGNITLRFRSGTVDDYFSESTKTGKLAAEFVIRIASDFPHRKDEGNGEWSVTHNLDDNLVWRDRKSVV